MANYATHTPYLLTACNHNGKKKSAGFTLYSIPDKVEFEFDEPFLHEKLFIGSQYGWLMVLDQHCEPSLLNPLTGESIMLPSITTLPTVRPCHSISGDIVSYFYRYSTIRQDFHFLDYTFDHYLRQVTFIKVVVSCNPSLVSSNNFVVAALVGYGSRLVVARPGESRWNLLQEKQWYIDIMFRQNGKLLCLTNFGALHEVEFNDAGDDFVITEISPQFLKENGRFKLYLAEDCAGRVLTILRKYNFIFFPETDQVKLFRLIVGNNINRSEESKWEQVKDLGGQAIFVGTNASFTLAKHEIHGEIKEDTVYFTDEWWDYATGDEARSWPRDICAYNLTNNSIKPCCPNKHQQCTWPLPVWIHLSNSI
ncbi:putative F-box protein [Carex littledalei]|uniref:Putative F-box protein n=1 Tax=Carex littledalei TaxID=544730 RepID=A0A833R4Y3_9POAL|nr:putative F-box protein [Carex littledalei]